MIGYALNKKRVMSKKYISISIIVLTFLTGGQSVKQETLKAAFNNQFLMGVAVNRYQIHQRNKEEHDLIVNQFNSLTAENDMKWMHIHPEKDTYNFEHADKLVEMAEANNMFVVGHTLIWHSQLAPWVFKTDEGDTIDSALLEERMKEHISTIVGRYKGKIKGWDVVNEALAEDGSLRKSAFLKVGGKDYISKAFQLANEADPEAELYYNDYNMISADKRDGAIRLVKELQAKGVKIDGIGIQAHWSLERPSINEIETAIEMYAALGIKVMFSELDISVLPSPWRMPTADISVRFENNPTMNPYEDNLPDSVQNQLAKRYADIFKLFSEHADKISRVTLWGLHDGLSWKNNFPIRGRTDYTLLFDRNLKLKKAFYAVLETARK